MIITKPPRRCLAASRHGLTLLEVLVACGILVVGLAGIAAILPAAGSRLWQAAREDRAGNLAANAVAHARSAGLIAADVFSNPNQSVAFGRGLETLHTIDAQRFAAAAPALAQRIDISRGFLLEDEIAFGATAAADTPVNEFSDGRRSFRSAVCWGATLVPSQFPARPGDPAVFTVVVFGKEPEWDPVAPLRQRIILTRTTSVSGEDCTLPVGTFAMVAPDESLMRQYLKGCSYVLATPFVEGDGPRWFRIRASWIMPVDPTTRQRSDPNCYVIFDDAAGMSMNEFAGPRPAVIGFEGLIRVDDYDVSLD